MKRIVLLISVAALALFASSKVSAQGKFGPDSAECIKYLSYYTEYYKQKNYDAALPNWRKAYKYCPHDVNALQLDFKVTISLLNILPNQQPFLFQGVGYLASPCVEELVVPLDLGYLLKVAQFC